MHFIGSALLESLSLWEQRRRPPPAALPSQALTRQLSQRESPWQAGQVSSGRAKLICFVDCSALLSRPAALPSQALTRQLSQRERLSSNADPIKCITLLPVGHTTQRKEGLFVQTFYKICLILMIIGGINWGLVGLFQFDFVGWLLGGSASIWSRIVFTLVGVAAVCGIPGLFTDETGE